MKLERERERVHQSWREKEGRSEDAEEERMSSIFPHSSSSPPPYVSEKGIEWRGEWSGVEW
jgi:hypothetical protein